MLNPFLALQLLAFDLSDRLKAVKENEKGASAVEYALLIGLIAAAVVAAVAVFGDKLKALFDDMDVTGKTPAAGGS